MADQTTTALVTIQPTGAALNAPSQLSEEARAFASEAMAPGTRAGYATKLRLWRDWAEARNLSVVPADPTAVANWISELATTGQTSGKRARRKAQGQALGTLRICVSALKAMHKAAGLPFASDHPAIALVLRGIARANAEVAGQAAPLGAELIRAIIERLSKSDDPRDARDCAILAVGYVFGRRRSEIVGLDLDRQGDGDGVLKRDVKVLEIQLIRHKTAGTDGQSKVFVVPRQGNELAVAAIERWISMAGIKPGQPVFCPVGRWADVRLGHRLTPEVVGHAIKRRIREHYIATGVDPAVADQHATEFSGHSLRVGLAVTAADAGADPRQIQTALGHASPAMAIRYAAKADQLKTSVHNLAGVGLGQCRGGGAS